MSTTAETKNNNTANLAKVETYLLGVNMKAKGQMGFLVGAKTTYLREERPEIKAPGPTRWGLEVRPATLHL